VDRRCDVPCSKALEAHVIAVARRRRVEHGATAERRSRPEDDPVATGGSDGTVEPELSEAVPGTDDPGGNVRSPVMDLDTCVVPDWDELVQDDVETVRDGICTWRDERLAPLHVVPLDPGKAHRHTLARIRVVDVLVVHLDAPHAHVTARRLEP
jgi:hypothetical protein